MHRLNNSAPISRIALILAFALALAPATRAAELEWHNTDGSGEWTARATSTNWWLASTATTVKFTQGNAVIFGNDPAFDTNNEINITATGGVTIGASTTGATGANPGMIVTGNGNWNFTFTATTTGTGATPNIGITGAGAGVLMQGTGTLTFSTTTGYTGATTIADGTLRLGVANAIAKSSAVVLSPGAALDLGGNNQTLLALSLAPGANVYFSGTGANHATLTLAGLAPGAPGATTAGGAFNLRTDIAGGAGDKIVITSTAATGAYTLLFSNTNSAAPHANSALQVVTAPAGAAATFTGTTEDSLYTYTVAPGQGDKQGSWYLANGTTLSRAADAVIHTAAVAGQDWLYSLDTLYKRMGDLREPPYGGDAAAGAQGGAGNLWLRANASRLNADAALAGGPLTGYGFHQYNYGATLGADKCLVPAGTMLLFAGAFADLQYISRSFDNNGTGRTNALGAGIYLTWEHADGWYADLIARADRNKNKLTAISTDGSRTSASYNATAQGISLEFGRLINWPRDWWIEPAIQYAAASIGGADYTATGPNAFGVHVGSTRASQTRLQFRFGEDDGNNPGWHPYAKLAAVYSSASGGNVQVKVDGAAPFAADYGGWRWEVGFGAAYVINERSQFYYDYEYAHAARYSRPWTLNAGYRLMW